MNGAKELTIILVEKVSVFVFNAKKCSWPLKTWFPHAWTSHIVFFYIIRAMWRQNKGISNKSLGPKRLQSSFAFNVIKNAGRMVGPQIFSSQQIWPYLQNVKVRTITLIETIRTVLGRTFKKMTSFTTIRNILVLFKMCKIMNKGYWNSKK